MKEQFLDIGGAELTTKFTASTLGRGGAFMEDGHDVENNSTGKLIDLIEDRKKRGIDPNEVSASATVWETFLNRELTSNERKNVVVEGVPFGGEIDEKTEQAIEKIVDDPRKFDYVLGSLDTLSPEILKETFSGDMAKIMVVILGEGVVNSQDYIERLEEIVESKSPRLAADIKEIVLQLQEDVENYKKKAEADEKERFPSKNVTDLNVVRAEKAWGKFIEERKRKGMRVSRSLQVMAERAIREGKSPDELSIGGGAGDDNFSNFNWEGYEDRLLRRIGLELKETGGDNKVTPQFITRIERELRDARQAGRVPTEEYEKFRTELSGMKNKMQTTRERSIGSVPQERQQSGQERSRGLLDTMSENIDRISDDIEPDEFRTHRLQIAGADTVPGAMTLKTSDPEELRKVQEWWNNLQYINDPVEFKRRAGEIMNYVNNFQPQQEEEEFEIEGLDDARLRGEKKGIRFNNIFQEGVVEGWFDPDLLRTEPRNVVDLAKWIMITDDARMWGPRAEYPLFRIAREAEYRTDDQGNIVINPASGTPEFIRRAEIEFQPASLIIWLRSKMLELHSDNSTDPMSPLQQVAIRTLYSPVSILAMKYDKQRYFSDPDTGEIMDDLYNEVILEAWLFGVRRNNDLAYRFTMNRDDALFEKIVELNMKNEHTSGTNAIDYYSMADRFVRGYDENGNPRLKDTKVGDGILLANAIYRNIPDYEHLHGDVLPEESPLFSREGWKNAVRLMTDKATWEDVKTFGNLYFDESGEVYSIDPKTKERSTIFDKSGQIDKAGFIKFLNFFTNPTALQSNIQVVRTLVKLAVAEEIGFETGLNYPPDKETLEKDKAEALGEKRNFSVRQRRDLKQINLNFAEVNSFVEQRWNGAAARADTGYRGYDAWTKLFAQRYRERQSGKDTMGPIGNPHDIPILKMLAPDMWLALRTEENISAQEIFERVLRELPKLYKTADLEQRAQLQAARDTIMSSLKFPDQTQLDWASNQVIRGANVWHAMLNTEDLGFSKLVTRNAWGALQYERGQFEKVVKDEFIKNRRYAFKSNNAINYGAKERVHMGNDADGAPIFKDMMVAEHMFGHDVIAPLLKDWYDGKLKYSKWDDASGRLNKEADNRNGTINDYLNSDEGRNQIFKNVCRAGLAAQLRAHRSFFGTGERWNTEMVLNFVRSLQTLRGYREDPPGSGREVATDDSFLTDEDIKWILRRAGAQYWKLARDEAGLSALDMAKGIPEIARAFFSGIVDLAA